MRDSNIEAIRHCKGRLTAGALRACSLLSSVTLAQPVGTHSYSSGYSNNVAMLTQIGLEPKHKVANQV